MPQFEYKVIPAPSKGRKIPGASGAEARFAATLQADLNAQASDGWEFLRAETLPLEERSGLTGTKRSFQTMLVFRRPVEMDERDATREALRLLENRSEDSPSDPDA